MKLESKILLFMLFLTPSIYLNAQWERIGFDSKSIYDICLIEDLLIIPISGPSGNQTVFYGSTNYGDSWDSLGFINELWIDELETMQNYLFSSRMWNCILFCPPAPSIFRSDNNLILWDTLYEETYGVYNLLVHNDIVFACTGDSFIKSIDSGNIWHVLESVPSNSSWLYSIDDLIYLVTNSNEIYNSEDNGLTWNFISNSTPASIHPLVKNNNYLFSGGNSGVARSSNGGLDWEIFNAGMTSIYNIRKLAGKPGIMFSAGVDSSYSFLVFFSKNDG